MVDPKDYEVSYQNNVDPGKAALTVRGLGDAEGGYVGSKTATFAIKKGKGSRTLSVSMGDVAVYAEGGAKPAVTVADEIGGSRVVLRPGVDYTVQYAKNKAATVPLVSGAPAEAAEQYRTAVATIKGKGNYRFTIRRTFAVLPRQLEDLTVYVEDKVASGGAKGYQKPKLFLTDGEGRSIPASRVQIVGYEVLGDALHRRGGTGEDPAGRRVEELLW